MEERIFKNWKTSLLGAVVILGALGAVFYNKATLTEAGGFMAVGLGLFFMKDSISQK